ncbi:MAG: trigger factor [Flavobacterium sp.]|nr:trigger factor [Flavobacterium sp.]
MAKVTRENVGLLTDKLSVTVTPPDYLPAFEKNLKQYAKTANIPGFRKGMVPFGLIRKMYGASVFHDEVLKTVETEINSYLFVEKLEIFAQPLPVKNDDTQLDYNNPKNYTFAFEIGLKPIVDINLAGINVTKYKIDITEEMITNEVERLQTHFGKMTEQKTVSRDEEVLNVTFTEVDAEGNVPQGAINKANSILVKYFTEDFKKNIIGLNVDDVVNVHLATAFNDTELTAIVQDLGLDNNDAASADKNFKLTINKIGFVQNADLNNEFYADAYPSKEIKNEEELRAAVKDDIAIYYDGESRNQLSDQIYHALLNNTTVQFPEPFLKRWLQLSGNKPRTVEEAEAEYPAFTNQMKWTLISSKLLKDYKIEVLPDDIRELAKKQLLKYTGAKFNLLGEKNQWLDDYANRMMQDNKFVEESQQRISAQKLFASLESTLAFNEEAISEKDFAKKLHHHHH